MKDPLELSDEEASFIYNYIEKNAPPQDEVLPEDYQKAMDEDSDYQLFLDEIEEVAF